MAEQEQCGQTQHLVLLGGGLAHQETISRIRSFLEHNYRVTLVQPSQYYYYAGMGPGMLGGTYGPKELRFDIKSRVEGEGGTFIEDRACRIDAERQLIYLEKNQQPLHYDVLSCSTGSFVNVDFPCEKTPCFTVKPVENLLELQRYILAELKDRPLTIGIVGGGQLAVEVAGNLVQLEGSIGLQMITFKLFCSDGLLPGANGKVRSKVRKILEGKGIEVLAGASVDSSLGGEVTLQDKRTFAVDLLVMATGVVPPPLFRESGLEIGPSGGLLVNEYLQAIDYPNIFGGGDCIDFAFHSLAKVGGYGVRQSPVLYENLMASLNGYELREFKPGPAPMLIYNLGGRTGILSRWGFCMSGKCPFLLREYIDHRIVRKYQSE